MQKPKGNFFNSKMIKLILKELVLKNNFKKLRDKINIITVKEIWDIMKSSKLKKMRIIWNGIEIL